MKTIFLSLSLWMLSFWAAAQSHTYRNPIIPGYHPDPSVCRVGDDFYLVNSSFQYFPGVPLFHSKDMVNWEQIGNVLDRDSQLNLKGATSWLGIYAPTIRHHDGTFYMITTNVGNGGNFMVTTQDPRGSWSDPIWLEQGGIDPSLYFEDGKCYMVSNPDNTIMLCEIDPKSGKQLTQSKMLWRGTGGRYPEGPHLYKKDGYYYLLISEGGTELAHSLTIARSRSIEGPYEANPNNPILTHCSLAGQDSPIQGTGHGDFVQAQDGSWWMVFLAYRNYGGSYHHLGRETFLAPVEWKAGEWPVVNGGQPVDTLMHVATLPQVALPHPPARTTFQSGKLGAEWVHLQNPIRANYQMLNGKLQLSSSGGSLSQNEQPTFVGRRQEHATFTAETRLTLLSAHDSDEAGISVYQINDGHADFYLAKTSEGYQPTTRFKIKSIEHLQQGKASASPTLTLRVRSDGTNYYFESSEDGTHFSLLSTLECSLLSTEVVGGFTGATLGMYTTATATFDYFDYQGE